MIFTIAFLSLLALAALVSVAYGARHGRSGRRRAILCALRLAMAVTVALSFIQPTLRLTRLAPERGTLGILVDASESMRLFDAGSRWTTLVAGLDAVTGERSAITVEVAAFGDSVQPLKPRHTPTFEHSRSLFPSPRELGELTEAREIILVTDGNWSNIAPPAVSQKATYHYVRLEQTRHRSFVAVEPTGPVPSVPQDSASSASVRLSGYSPEEGTIEIIARHRGRQVLRRSLTVAAGHFSDSVRLALPTGQVGSRLYEITGVLPDTALQSSCYLVQRVERKTIDVAFSAAAPSLDQRFVALALDRHPRFRRTDQLSKAAAVVVFDRDERSRTAVREAPPDGAVVFIGSLPCPSVSAPRPAALQPVVDRAYVHALPASLPAPSAVLSCDSGDPRVVRSIMTAAETGPGASGDQMPVLFEATHEGRRVLVLAARGIWRWDFWPQGLDEGLVGSRFTDFLVERMLELAEANANRSFYAYPTQSPVYDTDSLALTLVFPSSLREENSIPVTVTITTESGDTLRRGTVDAVVRGAGAARVLLPPLQAGTYRYECRLSGEKGSPTFADRIRVGRSDAELRVSGQNRVLLEQMAAPLDAADTSSLRVVAERLSASRAATVTHTIHLRQSAAMLAVLLVLLALEWFLRRAWRLD